MLTLSWTFELVIRGGDLRLLCRLAHLTNIEEEVVLQAFLSRWTLLWVNLQHTFEQFLELTVLLAPLVTDDVVEEKHIGDGLAISCS